MRHLLFAALIVIVLLSIVSSARLLKEDEATGEVEFWNSNEKQMKSGKNPASDSKESKESKEARKKRKQQKMDKLKGSGKQMNRPERKKKENKEIKAIRTWAETLTDKDYSYTYWKEKFHTRTASDFFNGYARIISDIWKDIGAKVNFALVGACDGLGDNTIKHLYLPNDHWRGVFVEPISINVKDLIHFMAKKNAAHRSLIIRAAATQSCLNETIKMERPLYEEKNKTIPV
jgi:hypothetical protein